MTTIFEQPAQLALYERKRTILHELLDSVEKEVNLRTALDVGCGVGLFTKELAQRGLTVQGVDGRASNIQRARELHPELSFAAGDVESPGFADSYSADLVLAYGLLYHLEDPLAAVRNLHASTKQILLVETQAPRMGSPIMQFQADSSGDDQGPPRGEYENVVGSGREDAVPIRV